MSDPLSVLAEALSDAGAFSWWTEALPRAVQLEFVQPQLAVAVQAGPPAPIRQVALRFDSPNAIAWVRKPGSNLPAIWQDELRNDRLKPLGLNVGEFGLSDRAASKDLLESAESIEWLLRPQDMVATIEDAPAQVAFWAGTGGALICSTDIHLVWSEGEIPIEQVQELHRNWWTYWKEYWRLRTTEQALPYDPCCEVVLPLESAQ